MPSYANMQRFFALALAFMIPGLALAQGTGLVNPLRAGSLPELVAVILQAVVELGSIAIVLMLVWSGFLFVKAQGNPGELETARKALFNTVIGGLLLLGASGIALILRSTVESL